MGMDYTIKLKLHADYSRENILRLLENGTKKGFIYYDQINYEKYNDIPVINADQAVEKIMYAYDNDIEGGPAVYIFMREDTNALWWFYKADDGFIEICIGAFGAPRKSQYFIDFPYYLKIFFDVCESFMIIEVHATMY